MSGTVCTPPVCTINRLHVARRPLQAFNRSCTYAEVDLAGFFLTVGHVGGVKEDVLQKENPDRGPVQLHVGLDVLGTATQNHSVSRKLNLSL